MTKDVNGCKMQLGTANRKEEFNMSDAKSAYKKLGKSNFYDGMITSTTFLGSLVNRIVWRMYSDGHIETVKSMACFKCVG